VFFIRVTGLSYLNGIWNMTVSVGSLETALIMRERVRDAYWKRRDPILEDRMLWRAQSFRHIMHVLPHQTILELGCGDCIFTRHLAEQTKRECPITALSFIPDANRPTYLPDNVEFLRFSSSTRFVEERTFDFIIAHDMLDRRSAVWLLQQIYNALSPGGRMLLYESNPWNVLLRLRRLLALVFGHKDPRLLLSRSDLYEMVSEVGFVSIFAVFNDFVYAPLTRQMVWLLRNLSIVLENTPGVRTLAGSILLHAEKPPRRSEKSPSGLPIDKRFHDAVSVVIPCHNEAMNVRELVSRLRELYDDSLHEIILVDDNSTDGTKEVIQALRFTDSRIRPIYRTPPNGVGLAVRDGLRAATGAYVLSLDCDFVHLLPEVRDLFEAIAAGYDVAVGSRFSRHSVVLNYPFLKIIVNRAFHVLAQVVLLARFRDVTNNLKLMRRNVVDDLVLLEPSFAVNAETGLQPLISGYLVKEVPLSWVGRGIDMGASSFRVFKVGGGYFRVLRRIWLVRFFGRGPYQKLRMKWLSSEARRGRSGRRICLRTAR
jgi:dolichol-phosphate mannosyltransferase